MDATQLTLPWFRVSQKYCVIWLTGCTGLFHLSYGKQGNETGNYWSQVISLEVTQFNCSFWVTPGQVKIHLNLQISKVLTFWFFIIFLLTWIILPTLFRLVIWISSWRGFFHAHPRKLSIKFFLCLGFYSSYQHQFCWKQIKKLG